MTSARNTHGPVPLYDPPSSVTLLPATMPLRSLILVAVCAGAVLLSGGASCGSASSAQTAADGTAPTAAGLDTARVARIDVPPQIAASDTLRVHLSGTVGPNGCYALARIDEARTAGRITLTPLVQPPTDDRRACTMAVVPLDTTHVVAPPFEPGPLTLTVPQSARPAMTTSIEVVRDP